MDWHAMFGMPKPEPEPEPVVNRWALPPHPGEPQPAALFNFDPYGVGCTREQFMAQADDTIDKYIAKIRAEQGGITTPVLANALLAVKCDNWHELMAVFFATALQRLASAEMSAWPNYYDGGPTL